ncbi:putative PEP-binding protein [Pseudoroseicyclus tamaricis]|uniref:Pyruvate, phosphate dikinase n=1 Tax=Pseudoroseicyclus tamaricis TaxID=2705421 RepID=A0A6B2JG85_9RHOB|nr:putative PEP-binding protein [Pseudoroseicyclus tamaricis]NDV00171.1 pyruvate, phosphate dikinase [Pseudoroseicyclus tamaricis]
MQQHARFETVTLITPTARMAPSVHGGRAKCLQRLVRLGFNVPTTVALSFDAVHEIALGKAPPVAEILEPFGPAPLLCVRPSSQDQDWGGPSAILNIGMNDARHARLCESIGEEAANALYLRFIQSYAEHVARLDPDLFHLPDTPTAEAVAAMRALYEEEMEEPFPDTPEVQLAEVLRSMARAWKGTSARLLRQSKGAPADAGLGLVVQALALGVGPGESGSGVIAFVNSETGEPQITGRYLRQSQGREALSVSSGALYITRDARGKSLEEEAPEAFAELVAAGELSRIRLREEMQVEFTIDSGRVAILDAVRLPRGPRAAVKIAVELASDGIIARDEAVMRVPASALTALLHPQVDPGARRDVVARGIAASPGAATGRLVLTAQEAQEGEARGEPCILIRRETSPEDIRGMQAAEGIITIRGGMTSHAAVIGRGIGLPCVVGAGDLSIDRQGHVQAPGGRVLKPGDWVTIDGSTGEILAGEAKLIEAGMDDSFRTLLTWADQHRDIGVRANADTPGDAQVARRFEAEGIGLCRTEHMFFEDGRIGLMREVIFSETEEESKAVLSRLLPLQRGDFIRLFEIMQGQPVCIRLFDPPLHEFLPTDKRGLKDMAEGLGKPFADVQARVEALTEYNPMLGMRGVRLGIAVPQIYEMQARAIFEAAIEAGRAGEPVVPEIMIPLVSAAKEVEVVKGMVEAVAAAVRSETGATFDYRLGVMVETPRAALRAADIAAHASFLSFGTNDLTQMAYGLSRDDAGRFMGAYVRRGVYEEDPFHLLDVEGVGELLQIGAARGRATRPDITVAICGEHGGSPRAIEFCRGERFTYVSCSPYRVPVARLSAAQLAIAERQARSN